MRRSISAIMFALAAGILSPAASAVASTQLLAAPQPQGFGVRLVDVPVSEADNPRALRYIIDYLPTGTIIHRRILIENQETRPARFTVYPDAADTDPWSARNVRLANLTVRAQVPPSGTDVSRFSPVIRYILDHTRADGTTVLQECPNPR